MKLKKIQIGIYLTLVILCSFLLLFHNGFANNFLKSEKLFVNSNQEQDLTVTINQDFNTIEYSEMKGNLTNAISTNINLPDNDWNITEINLNFSDIKLNQRVRTIEDRIYSTFKYIYTGLWEGIYYLGVQFNVSESTTLYGAYLYGRKAVNTNEKINISITKYHTIENRPTSPVYRSQVLNMSNTEAWYFQNFSISPLNLSTNKYYIILDGWNIKSSNTIYYWAYNKINPIYPYLYSAEYDTRWNVAQGQPFLLKLVEKVNRTYNPESINMQIIVDGNNFQVLNGNKNGSGYISISDINIFTGEKRFPIPIRIMDPSIEIIYNLSYSVKLQRVSSLFGKVLIKKNVLNRWILSGLINTYLKLSTIKFYYPTNWFNLRVYLDNVNVTTEILIKEKQHFLIIHNKLIENSSFLEIEANSPNIDFSLNTPKISFNPGQDLKFSIQEPVLKGKYLFILRDPLGFEEYKEFREIPPQNNTFKYTISQNPNEGIWNANIYWNNETDAGLVSQPFTIMDSAINNNIQLPNNNDEEDNTSETTNGIEPIIFYLIIIILISGTIGSIGSYQAIRMYKNKLFEKRRKIFNLYNDVRNLYYVIIMEKDSGLNVYEKMFSNKEANITLISGFLQAIRDFGIEITGSEDQSQIIKLEYKNLKIIMSEYKNFRIVSIMKDSPSQELLNSLPVLSNEIDKKFGKVFENYRGKRVEFNGLKFLLEKHMHLYFLCPFIIADIKNLELINNNVFFRIYLFLGCIKHILSIRSEKILIRKAIEIMKQNKSNHFHISSIMTDKEFNSRKAQSLLNLINKQIFVPIN